MLPSITINVYGLGYAGTISALCLAQRGHKVTLIDLNQNRVEAFKKGELVVPEAELQEIYKNCLELNPVKTTTDVQAAEDAELWLICVGTPLGNDNQMDFSQIFSCLKSIASSIVKHKSRQPIILIRSTVTPGFLRNQAIPLLEKETGLRHGKDFEAFYLPEFLREGTAVKDFQNPALNIIGYITPSESVKKIEKVFFDSLPLESTEAESVEIIKCASNTFHALKIAFANEIGSLCKSLGIDSQKTMELFRSDIKLNASGAYLKPGFAYGGPCLPKDIKSLLDFAKKQEIKLPLISNIENSNEEHIDRVISFIKKTNSKKVGVLGATFKSNTNDFRGSPTLSLISKLISLNINVVVFERTKSKSFELLTNFKNVSIETDFTLKNHNFDSLVISNFVFSNKEVLELNQFQGFIIDLLYQNKITQAVKTNPKYIAIC